MSYDDFNTVEVNRCTVCTLSGTTCPLDEINFCICPPGKFDKKLGRLCNIILVHRDVLHDNKWYK